MAAPIGIVLVAGIVSASLIGIQGATLLCLDCPLVANPASCNSYRNIHHDESCYAEVHEVRGTLLYTLSYRRTTACPVNHGLFGRRGVTNPYIFPPNTLRCRQCCQSSGCNRQLCAGLGTTSPHTQVVMVTTVVTTATPTTHVPTTSTSTTTTAATTRQHTTSTQAQTPLYTVTHAHLQTQTPTSFPCLDFEDATFSCATWASYGFCQPNPGVGYETAKLRCRKHCGFC